MITFSALGHYGQLGNQMFQYALLLGISEQCGYSIGLLSRASLDAYEIMAGSMSPADVAQCRRFEEPFFHFSPVVFRVGDQVDYHGRFQSEKYFAHAADRVRREFTLKAEPRSRVDGVMAKLRADGKPLVGVHVRRGDYLTLPNEHPPLGTDYYERALRLIPDAQASRYVVCSNDPAWCEVELPFLGDVVLSKVGLSPAEDIALMAACDHNIIANSTFSWWSAWLNRNPQKVVVAPKRWFGLLGPADSFDVVPASWLTT